MKKILSFLLILTICPIRAGDEWNNPPIGSLEKIVKAIVIPRINYDQTTGVEVLEFIRTKIWSIHPPDGDGTRPAHEYRCSPERLLKTITVKRQNISYGDALNEVCGQLALSWRIDRGKIVFADAPLPKQTTANKPVDATARSPVVEPTSTAPTHHL